VKKNLCVVSRNTKWTKWSPHTAYSKLLKNTWHPISSSWSFRGWTINLIWPKRFRRFHSVNEGQLCPTDSVSQKFKKHANPSTAKTVLLLHLATKLHQFLNTIPIPSYNDLLFTEYKVPKSNPLLFQSATLSTISTNSTEFLHNVIRIMCPSF